MTSISQKNLKELLFQAMDFGKDLIDYLLETQRVEETSFEISPLLKTQISTSLLNDASSSIHKNQIVWLEKRTHTLTTQSIISKTGKLSLMKQKWDERQLVFFQNPLSRNLINQMIEVNQIHKLQVQMLKMTKIDLHQWKTFKVANLSTTKWRFQTDNLTTNDLLKV